MAETVLNINPGLVAAIGNSAALGVVLLGKANAVKGIAGEIAPESEIGSAVSPPGHYKDSFHADLVEVAGALAGRVYNDDPIAAYIEYGTSTMEAQAVLHRALEGGSVL